MNTSDKYNNMVALTVTDIVWNWFKQIVNGIKGMDSLKEKLF